MNAFIASLLIICSLEALAQDFPAKVYRDNTAMRMRLYEKSGLELTAERTIEDIQVKLFLTDSANTMIKDEKFLVPDKAFDQEKLNTQILDMFETSITYFRQINQKEEIKELNLVLIDEGGDTGTISEVPQQSRVLLLHLGRWHKHLLKKQNSYVTLSSIHEFGHVINYMYSPKETKLHREFTAVLVECLHLIQLHGIEAFTKSYLKKFGSKIEDLEKIKSDDYTNMPVIRHLAALIFKNIYSGTYKGPEADAKKLTENFVITYLNNPLDGNAGLDDSLKSSGLLDASGIQLTFEQIKEDLYKELSRPTKKEAESEKAPQTKKKEEAQLPQLNTTK